MAPTVLSDDEVQRYRADGFLVPRYRLPADAVRRLQTATTQLIVYHHDRAEVRDQPGYGHESRALMLVRGIDRTGRNDFERGHARVNA